MGNPGLDAEGPTVKQEQLLRREHLLMDNLRANDASWLIEERLKEHLAHRALDLVLSEEVNSCTNCQRECPMNFVEATKQIEIGDGTVNSVLLPAKKEVIK
jgi:hypothetical protein